VHDSEWEGREIARTRNNQEQGISLTTSYYDICRVQVSSQWTQLSTYVTLTLCYIATINQQCVGQTCRMAMCTALVQLLGCPCISTFGVLHGIDGWLHLFVCLYQQQPR
jgi:hypothetical protein